MCSVAELGPEKTAGGHSMRGFSFAASAAALAMIIALAGPSAASKSAGQSEANQPRRDPIPDKFVNLLVLPKDITKPQLLAVMKGFCVTFNVRCRYCHEVSDDLTEGTFESDGKDTKRQTRELLQKIYGVRTAVPKAEE